VWGATSHGPVSGYAERRFSPTEELPNSLPCSASMSRSNCGTAVAEMRAISFSDTALGDHDKRSELAALARIPVEILVGSSDRLTPVPHSRKLAEALPEAVLHVEPRTGHMLLQERPQLVVDALGRLLAVAADRVDA
jgi:pimeloyl-ACP methyl ester carboxylesterase